MPTPQPPFLSGLHERKISRLLVQKQSLRSRGEEAQPAPESARVNNIVALRPAEKPMIRNTAAAERRSAGQRSIIPPSAVRRSISEAIQPPSVSVLATFELDA